MRKAAHAVFLLLFLAPSALAAQSVLTVPPRQCVWRAGDNLAWAAPSFDDSAWQPYEQALMKPSVLHLWIRCRADLSPLAVTPNPALQVGLFSAYELYLDGRLLGRAGNLSRGDFSLDGVRSYPVSAFPGASSLIALRVTRRNMLTNSAPLLRLLSDPLTLRAGDAGLLSALRAQQVLSRQSRFAESAVYFGVIGVLAVLLIGLYIYDRSRRDFLLLSLSCLSMTAIRLNEFGAASLAGYSYTLCVSIMLAGNVGLTFGEMPFFFAFVRRRIPLVFWILLGGVLVTLAPALADILLGARTPAWIGPLNVSFLRPASLFCHAILSLAPFVAFRPLNKLPRRTLPIAVLCMIWGIADLAWFALETTALQIPGVPNLFAIWGVFTLEVRGIATACVLAALLGLLFRDQRKVTEERAALAGEMHAAQQVQRLLAPESIRAVPGFDIGIAFLPAREVGGDFYSCRILFGNRQRILLGDVSGKGAAAAMTAAVLLGAAQQRESDSPAALLDHLNRAMTDMRLGGFATCLCAEISADGALTLANGGHLAPYRNGQEVQLESGLPLGIAEDTEYTQTTLKLLPGDRLAFLSDGVVEAQNEGGELFGFDRTRSISDQSAEEIARAAQQFGQADDITVLTVTFAPAEVLHA